MEKFCCFLQMDIKGDTFIWHEVRDTEERKMPWKRISVFITFYICSNTMIS